MTQRIAIYPTSANPPTLGHADILVRTARYFDYVYWAAAINPEKTYSFTEEQRLLMMSEYIQHHQLKMSPQKLSMVLQCAMPRLVMHVRL